MRRSTRILWGLFALVLAAVLFTAGEFFLVHPDLPLNPTADPELFAKSAAEGEFAFWAARGLVGAFLETVGMIALYLYLQDSPGERLAFWGLLISLVGDFVSAVVFGSAYFFYPRIGAYALEEGMGIVSALEVSPTLLALMAVSSILGLVLFASAIWRSGILPRWSGVVMLAGFVLILAALDVFVLQVLGNATVGLGALWIFVHAWRRRDV
jgi:hypothetical protein